MVYEHFDKNAKKRHMSLLFGKNIIVCIFKFALGRSVNKSNFTSFYNLVKVMNTCHIIAIYLHENKTYGKQEQSLKKTGRKHKIQDTEVIITDLVRTIPLLTIYGHFAHCCTYFLNK